MVIVAVSYIFFAVIDLRHRRVELYLRNGWPSTFEFYDDDCSDAFPDGDYDGDLRFINWLIKLIYGNIIRFHDLFFVLATVFLKS